jgi:hypothetical protein
MCTDVYGCVRICTDVVVDVEGHGWKWMHVDGAGRMCLSDDRCECVWKDVDYLDVACDCEMDG